ncbi:YraN family protein [Trinickia diaoshuihuensis]|uniref:YraN family protein n=1 Tax=Trinickia diaoshuihuensis TaxID=2292265 RepID=UPI0013C2A908|nr:YraN family protein [Trinickia diaoshuihuensis]
MCHARRDATAGAARPTRGSRPVDNFSGRRESKRVGAAFEEQALAFLRRQRMRLVARNVTCRGGEIDLVMRDADGVLVFVEVRARAGSRYGGAAASIGLHKRQRILFAARYFLSVRGSAVGPCRFDAVVFEGRRLIWLRDAFREDDG